MAQSSVSFASSWTSISSSASFLFALLITLTISFRFAESYFLVIDAHAEECFFDRVTAGTKMGLMFEVVEGGFLDIDVSITGPDHKAIHREERASSGKYTFSAHIDGDYSYCFGNKMSTMTPKVLMFSMEIETTHRNATALDDAADGHRKLSEQITDLANVISTVKHEQEYMAVRDRIHRQISESTNSRVVLWACFEAFLLISMTLSQVFYLRRFFEVRRVV